MAVIYKGVRYLGVWAHKAWKGQRLPRTLWTMDTDCSVHFPGREDGYDYDLVGYTIDTGVRFKKWRAFKV